MSYAVKTKSLSCGINFEVQDIPEPRPVTRGYYQLPLFVVRAAQALGKTDKIGAIKFVREFYAYDSGLSLTLGLLEAKLMVEYLLENPQ